jgi:hypothetical protein
MRSGAVRILLPQRHRQLRHLHRGTRALARAGHQRIEPTGTPVAMHRSIVCCKIRTRRPNGSACPRDANSRTIFPRSPVECAGSAGSRIN